MNRSTTSVAALGTVTAALAGCIFIGLGQRNPIADSLPIVAEAWPICSSMDAIAEGPAWAPLDPDFAAGKKALAAKDWRGAIAAFESAALRDTRNADIQNYLGYAHRRLWQLDLAFTHYRRAVSLNPRHRSAHEHLGEAYLVLGDLPNAEAQLDALRRICLLPCDEYADLERAIAGTAERNVPVATINP